LNQKIPEETCFSLGIFHLVKNRCRFAAKKGGQKPTAEGDGNNRTTKTPTKNKQINR
jgi:hypothetical protein